MFTLFFFVFIVTPGRGFEIDKKKSNVNNFTLLDQVNTLSILEKALFVVYL